MNESERAERKKLLHMLGYMTRDEVYLVMDATRTPKNWDRVEEIIQSWEFPCYRVFDDTFTSVKDDYLYSIKDIKEWIASLPEHPKRKRI